MTRAPIYVSVSCRLAAQLACPFESNADLPLQLNTLPAGPPSPAARLNKCACPAAPTLVSLAEMSPRVMYSASRFSAMGKGGLATAGRQHCTRGSSGGGWSRAPAQHSMNVAQHNGPGHRFAGSAPTHAARLPAQALGHILACWQTRAAQARAPSPTHAPGASTSAPLFTRTLAVWPMCLYALRSGTRSRLISTSSTTSLQQQGPAQMYVRRVAGSVKKVWCCGGRRLAGVDEKGRAHRA